METELYKVRSLAHCFKAAYDLYSTNLRNIFRKTWQPAAAIALVNALLTTFLLPLFAGNVAARQPAPSPVVIGLALLLVLVAATGCMTWLTSAVVSLLNGYSLRANFKRVLRLYLVFVGIGIVLGLLVLGLAFIPLATAKGMPTPQNIMLSGGITLLAWVVIMVCLLPLAYSTMKFYIEPDQKIKDVFGRPYRKGWHFWGYLFLMMLIVGIICGVIYVVVMMPEIILQSAAQLDGAGRNLGDPSGLPGYFPLLVFIATLICATVWTYVMVWAFMVNYYAYGHIEAKIAAKAELVAPVQLPLHEEFPPIE